MTTLVLLGYISAALLVQIVVLGIFAAFRWKSARYAPIDEVPSIAKAQNAAWAGLRAFRVRARHDEDEMKCQTSFVLEPVDGVPLAPYRGGQFLTFQLDIPGVDGISRTATRCYSLSDGFDPNVYRITIKRVPAPLDRPELPPGIVSNHFHDNVVEGTTLQVRAPAGVFVLDDDANIPAVLVAGGIGITPLYAMARAALAADPNRNIRLYHGVRDRRELVFADELAAMAGRYPNFRFTIVESSPLGGEQQAVSGHLKGFIDVALLQSTLPHGQHQFYICGPTAMMENLVPALRAWGVARDAVHYETFGPASIEMDDETDVTPTEVRFDRSTRTLGWTGEDSNLLDFAERNGVAVESGCRSGSCGSCETTILSGSVRCRQEPAFDVSAGCCLLCISVPDGELVLDA